jgi:hypothetical protein
MVLENAVPQAKPQPKFVIRLNPAEKKAIEDASWSAHMERSTWARSILLREAEKRRKM